MTAFDQAYESAREERNCAALVTLLRSRYQPTDVEWEKFAALSLNVGKESKADENGDTPYNLMLADAWDHYDGLRAMKVSKEDAISATCADPRFPITETTLRDVVRWGRKPVRAIRNRRRASDSNV
jgi:hypothetical protein